jgi:carbonic anhydrase
MSWLDEIVKANQEFRDTIQTESLPTQRQPGPYAVITCMDPRINLAAAGIPAFTPDGASKSQVRVIRTLGGLAEPGSLLVGIHLAGFKELAVIMHTDCGLSLAHEKIDVIATNLEASLSTEQLAAFKRQVGEPFRDKLRAWLQSFEDPYQAVRDEVARIRGFAFVPHGLIIHGLVYGLASGGLEIVHNGYDQ